MKNIFKLLAVALLLILPAAAETALPGELRIIEEEAFCGAASIGEIQLPQGVREIRARAFADSSLTAINLPESLTCIAGNAFEGCDRVNISVSPDTPAWDWCLERGMSGAEWSLLDQTDSDSVFLQWSAPENVACNVLMRIDGEWTHIDSEIIRNECRIDGLSSGTECVFALEFSGTESVTDGGTTYVFSYSFRTEPRTIALLDCDYSWWIQDGECIITGARLWNDVENVEIRIPAELDSCPVTRLGPKSFTCMEGLTKATLPDSVRRIDSTAFYGCANLAAVEMTGSVLTIGDYAFAACPALTDVRLSNSITSIGDYAFWNDAALSQIDLPAALVRLGKKSLYGTGITRIVLPDALCEIGAQVWNDDISEIITGENAATFSMLDGNLYANGMTRLVWFSRHSTAAEFIAPETVTEVAAHAFSGCNFLQRVVFPGGLTSICENAFENCSMLSEISGTERLISIGDRAFHGCAVLSDDAFQSMHQLETVGAHAFHDCALLQNMPLPQTLRRLGESAFEGCASLISATLGAEMTSIGSAAFYGCTALESVEMPAVLTEPEGFGSYMFYDCAALRSISVPTGVTKLDNYTFHGCTKLTTLVLPEGLETIGSAVCFKCNALTGLVIPDSVISIGSYAFTYCRALTEIDLPACPVGSYGFAACTSLKRVAFAESAQTLSLDNRAFYACSALQSAYLPANVTAIHAAAFESCPKVTLHVEENSAAHTFALENGLKYQLTNSPEPPHLSD